LYKNLRRTEITKLGTKNTNLKRNPDGSLTLYAGSKSPGRKQGVKLAFRARRQFFVVRKSVLRQTADSRPLSETFANYEGCLNTH
jgi:hypothetical protein